MDGFVYTYSSLIGFLDQKWVLENWFDQCAHFPLP